MNISLPKSLLEFVKARVAERFSSVSEYVRELIREDQRRARREKAEDALATRLSDSHFDRASVKETIEGLRSLRRGLADRGVKLTAEEIQGALDEGRK